MKQRRKREPEWREALVTAPLPPRLEAFDLPDPHDWPIVATAIVGQASTILTYDGVTSRIGCSGLRLSARHPDR
jgi:hypothetical protein